jgi:hypothetical protein
MFERRGEGQRASRSTKVKQEKFLKEAFGVVFNRITVEEEKSTL